MSDFLAQITPAIAAADALRMAQSLDLRAPKAIFYANPYPVFTLPYASTSQYAICQTAQC
jgi:hypothetical protein